LRSISAAASVGAAAVVVLSLASAAAAADGPSAAVQLVAEFSRTATESPAGPLAFALAHLCAVVVCFPGTVAFELAAGALFGFLPGVALVTFAKGGAAAVAFALVRLLGDGPVGLWARERASGAGGDEGGKWAERVRVGVQRGGFRFCVLARLSPVPSWVNNYVLPIAGVPFSTYLPATVLGMLPPLAGNVYSGVAAASVVSALAGGGGVGLDQWGLVLQALSALSGAAVVQQLASEALGDDLEQEEGRSKQ